MGAWPVCSKKAGQSSGTSSKSSSKSSTSSSKSSGASGSSSSKGSGSTTPLGTKPVEAVAAPSGGSYTVASGDTLSEIAAAHGTTAQSIAQRSAIANPDALTPGQKITVS